MLSNMTKSMMADGLARAGLSQEFDAILSTDSIRTFKPDPRAYRLGIDALHLNPRDTLFAAFAGWDVAGATWFGYPTYWVNRARAPAEQLGATPDGAGDDLAALVKFVTGPAA